MQNYAIVDVEHVMYGEADFALLQRRQPRVSAMVSEDCERFSVGQQCFRRPLIPVHHQGQLLAFLRPRAHPQMLRAQHTVRNPRLMNGNQI